MGTESFKLSSKVKNIIDSELESNIKIRMDQSETNSRMRKIAPKYYSIEMNYNNFDENIWLHECMHIYQFENGYPKLNHIKNCNQMYIRLIIKLQDLVLDTYLNRRLFDVYHYKIKQSCPKYIGYSNQIKNINRNNINNEFVKLMVIEAAYIYFNDNKKLAIKLLNQTKRKTKYDILSLFYKIVDIIKEYEEPTASNCEKAFSNLISVLQLENYCSIVSS